MTHERGVMRQGIMVMVSVVCFLIGSLGVAKAAEGVLAGTDVSGELTVDFYSRYVWRGFMLDNDPVVQPGFSLSAYGITASFWGSFDARNRDELASDEVDFTLDYAKEFDGFSVSVGVTHYAFPGGDSYSDEVYAGIAFDVFLSPQVTVYHDYGDEAQGGGDGQYIHLAVGHSITLEETYGTTFDLSAGVGFNNELFIAGTGGDYAVSAGLTIPLSAAFSLRPTVGYTMPFGDVKAASDGGQKNRFYSGISVAGNF